MSLGRPVPPPPGKPLVLPPVQTRAVDPNSSTTPRSTVSTVFTKIIEGKIPGRFVWKDDDVVAFLSIGPLTDGHTLVVPRQEIDKWTDAPAELLAKLTGVAQIIGTAQQQVFGSARAGLVIAGFEVEHLHIHVFPANTMADFDFGQVDNNPDPAVMDDSAEKIRGALRVAGHGATVPEA
jgi:diadenosine tetraphosphate (Ap4A) HIT family hydrolase